MIHLIIIHLLPPLFPAFIFMSEKNRKRLRRVSFTYNNPSEDTYELINSLYFDGYAKFLIYQEEKAPTTGTPHIQGYVEFTKQYDFSKIKKLLPEGAHLEASRGTKSDNVRYCRKPDGRLSGPFVYGDLASNQGQRTDLYDAVAMLGRHRSVQECVADDGFATTYVKYSSGFNRLAALKGIGIYTPTEPEEKSVVALWGGTGTGKTHTAYTSLRTLYPEEQPWFASDLSGRWFDGYAAQRGVIFDDFRGYRSEMKVDQFLRLTDKWPMQVPVKGSFVNWNPRTIYITSNEDPAEWYYNESANTQAAVARRLSSVIHLNEPYRG